MKSLTLSKPTLFFCCIFTLASAFALTAYMWCAYRYFWGVPDTAPSFLAVMYLGMISWCGVVTVRAFLPELYSTPRIEGADVNSVPAQRLQHAPERVKLIMRYTGIFRDAIMVSAAWMVIMELASAG